MIINKIFRSFILCFFLLESISSQAQLMSSKTIFTHGDSLRGTYGPLRSWFDVTHYDLHTSFDYAKKTISGYNAISLTALSAGNKLQMDLQEPLEIDSVTYADACKKNVDLAAPIDKSNIEKDGNAYFITLPKELKKKDAGLLTIYYHGTPRQAKNPPWDGGLIWKTDTEGKPWISAACQGLGASVWYPCKDHQADEPDSADMYFTANADMITVSNGRLKGRIDNDNGKVTTHWQVKDPINNYNIIPYIGNYVHFGEVYDGEKGPLDLNYWVLAQDLEKAKVQFKQVPQMIKAFEYWFGPYPFYEDGYKLVQSPHLGMEHQSAVGYGNKFQNGYLGRDLSGSGWGLKFDFIIIHESGHEWFANNITSKDIADMWIHEGFTNYSETLFVEYYYGKEAANAYLQGVRKNILNDRPVVGPYNVNKEGSGDMYNKGSGIIHTIRQVINNDEKFRSILRGLNKNFYHQTVTTAQVEKYISKKAGHDFSIFFDQYLRTIQIPALTYKIKKNKISYKFENCVPGFSMPVKVFINGKEQWINASEKLHITKNQNADITSFEVDKNFYINVEMAK